MFIRNVMHVLSLRSPSKQPCLKDAVVPLWVGCLKRQQGIAGQHDDLRSTWGESFGSRLHSNMPTSTICPRRVFMMFVCVHCWSLMVFAFDIFWCSCKTLVTCVLPFMKWVGVFHRSASSMPSKASSESPSVSDLSRVMWWLWCHVGQCRLQLSGGDASPTKQHANLRALEHGAAHVWSPCLKPYPTYIILAKKNGT